MSAASASAASNTPHRSMGRSVAAVFLSFLAVVVLSLGTDQMFHVLNVYPPWGEPMYAPELNLLALSYRSVYGILGGYLTARLAPHSPMRHVWVGGGIGFALSLVGVIGASQMNLGPMWYPILLAATALPTSWLGGVLFFRSNH
jgi:hypothetical protein